MLARHAGVGLSQQWRARIPYCHAWFENYFIECNIKLLDAFDNETLPVFQGFGSLMDQCYLQSFGRLCEWSGASKALNLYLLLRNTSCLRPVRSRNRGTRASERVDLEVCFSGPFEGGWAGSILKCSIIRNFLKINIYLSNHAWQYGKSLLMNSVPLDLCPTSCCCLLSFHHCHCCCYRIRSIHSRVGADFTQQQVRLEVCRCNHLFNRPRVCC